VTLPKRVWTKNLPAPLTNRPRHRTGSDFFIPWSQLSKKSNNGNDHQKKDQIQTKKSRKDESPHSSLDSSRRLLQRGSWRW
jgi:hypothetical protein